MEEIVHPENLNAAWKPVGDRFYMRRGIGNRSATGSTWGEVGAGGGWR